MAERSQRHKSPLKIIHILVYITVAFFFYLKKQLNEDEAVINPALPSFQLCDAAGPANTWNVSC